MVGHVHPLPFGSGYTHCMKLFRILKALSFLLVGSIGIRPCEATGFLIASAARPAPLTLQSLVTQTLIRGLEATEIAPVPATSPACLLIAAVQGPDGVILVNTDARLLMVSGDIDRDTLRQLSGTFGASGLKVQGQLVILTSQLVWVNQQGGAVLNLGFERGPFTGFFGTPHQREMVKVARHGDELCVASGP